MNFDFDHPPDRSQSDSMKWGRYAGRDVLPMWVADMDFAVAPPIVAALQRRIEHGVFGYATESPALVRATVDYLARHYDWKIESDWLVWLPGLVTGLNVACRAIEGAVFTATPVYPPFMSAPRNAERPLVTQTLQNTPDGWRWDFAAVEEKLAASKAKLWLLCHPHNPVGRAWNEDELHEIARLARKHDVTICSDEIHCDLVLNGRRHTPFAALDADAAQRSITLMAPSKTYNVPGLGAAFAVVPNADLRRRFRNAMNGIVPHINLLGLVAAEAAMTQCDDWLAALIGYLRGNAEHLRSKIAATPGLTMHAVEATYLGWIDADELCSEHEIGNPQQFFEAHGLGLSAGADFALAGESARFVRLNFGCSREQLDTALARIAKAAGSF